MRVVDAQGLVHVATSRPKTVDGLSDGDVYTGKTRCGRWWVWTTMRITAGDVLRVAYSNKAPTCLGCVHERRSD